MERLPFLLRLSFEGMFFALVLPSFWVALATIVAAALVIRRRQLRGEQSPARWLELLSPFVFPGAILLWAAMLYASLQGKASGWYWQELGIFGLLLFQVVTVVWLLARHRARLYLTLTVSIVAILWAAGATFVAGMAVYNAWL